LINRSPGRLNFWRVLYTGVPEGIVTTSVQGATNTIADVQEGAPLAIKFGFQNISPLPFLDSLQVNSLITNQASGKTQLIIKKIKALGPGLVDTISITGIPTNAFAGDNRIDVFVNPRLQAELYYSNNILQYTYRVIADKSQPVLDVVFDGVRIMDGDIINPSPFISITLKDNNSFKQKTDTVGLSLLITPPGNAATPLRIAFGDPRVQWYAATASTPFRLEFRPGKLEDGKYRLQVSGADATGNTSGGGLSYAISFSVINESRMSHFYPYPNPFSSSTRFVFTLTGSKVPDELKIQIMTVSGRVVREITKNELGPIKIGNNLSSYAWDGTDEYGDKLANGVYLYKVTARSEGANMELFNTAADDTFKYGFGKMYIMR
jgi:FlgD Ig-like domain